MTRKLVILITDPDAEERAHLAAILRTAGYTVAEAASLFDAEHLLAEAHPDLVILELDVNGGDGAGFCREIRNSPLGNSLPVVFLTRKRSKEDILRGLNSGANDYLTKPWDEQELLLRIRNILRFRDIAGGDPEESPA